MTYDLQRNTFEGPMNAIIQKFGDLNQQYEETQADAAHWYTEGTCTALLSVAAWNCEHPALCETQGQKQKLTRRQGRPAHSNGRVDLFLYEDDQTPIWIEAKKIPGSMDASDPSDYTPSKARLSRWFWTAYDSAEKNRREARANTEGIGKIGCLLFCSFLLKPNYYDGRSNEKLRQERALSINKVLQEVVDEDEGECHFASFFNTSETAVIDEIGNRAFGFAVLGYFEDA